MDKLEVNSGLMKGIIAKLIMRAIKNKLGNDMDIKLSELNVVIEDGKAIIHLNADVKTNVKDIIKMVGI